MPTAARTHQSRERVFVVGLVTGEISGTVSGLVRASVDGNVNLRVISGRIADGAAVSIPIFLGDFDGQGHKITGLCLTESCSEYGLFSRVESGASVRNLTVEGEVIPAGTQTDVGGIVGQMVPDITLRFSSGGLDELQTELNALQSLINRTPDTAQLRADIGALQAADGVPEELLHLTLRFVARGKVLKRQTFGYGDSFTADDFPEAPKKDGCYADWNVTDLSDLRFDTTVTAVYRPYVTALAADDTADGRPAPPGCGRSRSRRTERRATPSAGAFRRTARSAIPSTPRRTAAGRRRRPPPSAVISASPCHRIPRSLPSFPPCMPRGSSGRPLRRRSRPSPP